MRAAAAERVRSGCGLQCIAKHPIEVPRDRARPIRGRFRADGLFERCRFQPAVNHRRPRRWANPFLWPHGSPASFLHRQLPSWRGRVRNSAVRDTRELPVIGPCAKKKSPERNASCRPLAHPNLKRLPGKHQASSQVEIELKRTTPQSRSSALIGKLPKLPTAPIPKGIWKIGSTRALPFRRQPRETSMFAIEC